MIQRLAAGRGVGIVDQRQHRFGDQRISTGAGRRAVAAESIERNDQERRRGDQRDTEDAASGPIAGAAQAERDLAADMREGARS